MNPGVVVARILRLALAAAAVVAAPPAAAAETRAWLGGVEAVAWTPPGGAMQGSPVVVFSHGLGMCPTQARFLTQALAGAGYLVIAPYHADSACEFVLDLANPSRVPLKPAALWGDDDYRDRAEDVRAVLRGLAADPTLGPRADVSSVGLVGHSLGGYTVLGLAGAWPSWPTPPGVKAVVAQAAYALPLLGNGALERLRVPVMFQVGAADPTFSLPISAGSGAYARAAAPKVLVEISLATHFAWTDAGLVGRDAIVATTLAFLDHHVRGVPERAALLERVDGVASLERDPPAARVPRERPSYADEAMAAMRAWIERARRLWR